MFSYKVNICSFDDSVVVKSDFEFSEKRISVSGQEHVLVPIQHDSDGSAVFRGGHGSDHGDQRGPSFFAAESTLNLFKKHCWLLSLFLCWLFNTANSNYIQ